MICLQPEAEHEELVQTFAQTADRTKMCLAPRQAVDREEERLRRSVEDIVGDRYVDSNRQTAALLGVDLGAYGWMI